MRARFNVYLRRWAHRRLTAQHEADMADAERVIARLEREVRLLAAKLEVQETQLELQRQVIAREHARVSAEIQIQAAREAEHRA